MIGVDLHEPRVQLFSSDSSFTMPMRTNNFVTNCASYKHDNYCQYHTGPSITLPGSPENVSSDVGISSFRTFYWYRKTL